MEMVKIDMGYIQSRGIQKFLLISLLIHMAVLTPFVFSFIDIDAPSRYVGDVLWIQVIKSSMHIADKGGGGVSGKAAIKRTEGGQVTPGKHAAGEMSQREMPESGHNSRASSLIAREVDVQESSVVALEQDLIFTERIREEGIREGWHNAESVSMGSGYGGESTLYMEGFRKMVLDKIERNKIYPYMARRLGIEGDVQIGFWVYPDGSVHDISANGKKENFAILEQAVVELIQGSSPFKPSPYYIDSNVRIHVVISYKLEGDGLVGRE